MLNKIESISQRGAKSTLDINFMINSKNGIVEASDQKAQEKNFELEDKTQSLMNQKINGSNIDPKNVLSNLSPSNKDFFDQSSLLLFKDEQGYENKRP